MDGKQTLDTQPRDAETKALSRIVDAMLIAEDDLRTASVEQWTRTLVEACRRQKRVSDSSQGVLASSC